MSNHFRVGEPYRNSRHTTKNFGKIKGGAEAASEHLEELGFDPPGSDWNAWRNIGRTVGIKEIKQTTMQEIYDAAIAWVSRRRLIRDLASESDAGPSGQADNEPDSRKQTRRILLPENPAVIRLAKQIRSKLGTPGYPRKSDVAIEFTNGDEQKAANLLRQLQPSRFGHLLDD